MAIIEFKRIHIMIGVNVLDEIFIKNGLIVAFLIVGVMLFLADWISKKIFSKWISGVAIAILVALVMAYFVGHKEISNHSFFSGMALLGGAMYRDFTIVSTAMGANLSELRKTGLPGIISLLIGVTVSFFVGGSIRYAMGYTDAVSFTAIGVGACTYIVGPITGAAIGATSDLIAISIAAGVVKTIFVSIITPLVAKKIGLDKPSIAMIFGGMIGTTSGLAAGLAATDPKLVPYGALTATFYTGVGVLLCPSVFYLLMVYLL